MTQTPPGNGQAPSDGQPATGTPPATDVTSGTKLPQSIDEALKQVESLQAALKAANKESAGHRIKAKELDELKAKLEADKLSETEKLQSRIKELEAQHQEQAEAAFESRIEAEIYRRAQALGIVDPDAAAKLIDWEEIDVDEATGKPKNLGELLSDLLKKRPYLAGRSSPTSGGATNPSRSSSSNVGEITMGNLSEAMSRYNELSDAQKQTVQRLLINRR